MHSQWVSKRKNEQTKENTSYQDDFDAEEMIFVRLW